MLLDNTCDGLYFVPVGLCYFGMERSTPPVPQTNVEYEKKMAAKEHANGLSPFKMKESQSLDELKREVQEAVKKQYPAKKGKSGDTLDGYDGCWIETIEGGKAIVRRNDKKYGIEFTRDLGTREITITRYVPVDVVFVEAADSEGEDDGDEG